MSYILKVQQIKRREANITLVLLVTKAEELDTCYAHQREKNGKPMVEISGWVEVEEI